ncbi:MAG: T9SS type A sorting domain-containing protein [candidate division Zixibacteria bacterium]|nr:T9SS type A sorting domain-containing protein [candidate division Zixibacteria bacterium]
MFNKLTITIALMALLFAGTVFAYDVNKDLVNKGPVADDIAVILSGSETVTNHYDGYSDGRFNSFAHGPDGANTKLHWQNFNDNDNDRIDTGQLIHVGWSTSDHSSSVKDMYWTDETGQRIPGSVVYNTTSGWTYEQGFVLIRFDNFFDPQQGPGQLPIDIIDVNFVPVPEPFPLAELNMRNEELNQMMVPVPGGEQITVGPGEEIVLELGDFPPDMSIVLRYVVMAPESQADAIDFVQFSLTEDVPCCDVDMVPDDDPVIVEPGGRFGFTGIIGNPTMAPIVTDVWGGVIYMGNLYQQFAFNNISLAPGQYLSAHSWQNVPGYAQPGTYDYVAYCGDRPDVICDEAAFPFTIVGARSTNGADEWSLEGEFFSDEVPTDYALMEAYPNPFNANTTITYELPEAGFVNLEVYNLRGQKVVTLVNEHNGAGRHRVSWDASEQASGVYFYKLTAGETVLTKRMTLLK